MGLSVRYFALLACTLFSFSLVDASSPNALSDANDPESMKIIANLIDAASRNDTVAARSLLTQHGSNYATSSFMGKPLIHLTAMIDRLAIVQLLVQHGASIDTKDARGTNLLMAAARMGRAEIVQWLLLNGADPNEIEPWSGSAPLHAAALLGNVPIIEALLRHGADPNTIDKNDRTPLHTLAFSTDHGRKEIVKSNEFMLKAVKGKVASPLYAYDVDGAVEALVAGGANVNGIGGIGNDPLLLAAYKHNWELARALVRHGADPYIEYNMAQDVEGVPKRVHLSVLAKQLFYEDVVEFLQNEKIDWSDVKDKGKELNPSKWGSRDEL